MKRILIACNHSKIDTPLRRSLAHLVKSCQIRVVSNGYQVFEELEARAFDLITLDSDIAGIDSLELAESIEFIDPGIPIILMLKQPHKKLWGPARQVKANPILRPFKPLTFLRLVDTLLHQQLERYRDLSDTLKTILQITAKQTAASSCLLIDGAGQILVSSNEAENPVLKSIGALVATKVATNGLVDNRFIHNELLLAQHPAEKDHELYLTLVLDKLYLGLLQPVISNFKTPHQTWQQLGTTAQKIQQAFYEYTLVDQQDNPDSAPMMHATGSATQDQILIPLKLEQNQPVPAPNNEDEETINWQIITNSSVVLNRLQDFCQVS